MRCDLPGGSAAPPCDEESGPADVLHRDRHAHAAADARPPAQPANASGSPEPAVPRAGAAGDGAPEARAAKERLLAIVRESRAIVKEANEVSRYLLDARRACGRGDYPGADELLVNALATHQWLLNKVRALLRRSELEVGGEASDPNGHSPAPGAAPARAPLSRSAR